MFNLLLKYKLWKYHQYNFGLRVRDPLAEHFQAGDGRMEKRLGAAPPNIRENGDWDIDIPPGEPQFKEGFESWSCVLFSMFDAIETITFAKYGIRENWSDRSLVNAAEVQKGYGTYFSNGPDAVRKVGLIPESKWPFDAPYTWEHYTAPLTWEALLIGERSKNIYRVSNEFIDISNKEKRTETMKRSPLQVAVQPWFKNAVGTYYSKPGAAYTHAVLLYKTLTSGKTMILDHYKVNNEYIKTLREDYQFHKWALAYYVDKMDPMRAIKSKTSPHVYAIMPDGSKSRFLTWGSYTSALAAQAITPFVEIDEAELAKYPDGKAWALIPED